MSAAGLVERLEVYWPVVFALGTMGLMLVLDASTATATWPPTLELSGRQALRVFSSPVFLATVLPLFAGLLWLRGFAVRSSLTVQEHASMVWWLTNIFWFHTGCDLLSGFWQRMPVLTELYRQMNPAHDFPRWHDARNHLDACYALELLVEVPMAAWVFWLAARRHPARGVAEVFALGAQFSGTIVYYAPGFARGEAASWLSWVDRSCGAVWLLFPALQLRRHVSAARAAGGRGPAQAGKEE